MPGTVIKNKKLPGLPHDTLEHVFSHAGGSVEWAMTTPSKTTVTLTIGKFTATAPNNTMALRMLLEQIGASETQEPAS